MDMTKHYHDLYGDETKDEKIKRLRETNRAFAEQVTNDYKEIKRLREALKECAKKFTTKSSNHYIAAQEILDEFERRALIAQAALQQKEIE